jgi:hypothetical protein
MVSVAVVHALELSFGAAEDDDADRYAGMGTG